MAGVAILLNRQEKGRGEISAIEEAEKEFNLRVVAVITLADLIEYLQQTDLTAELKTIQQYREKYGTT